LWLSPDGTGDCRCKRVQDFNSARNEEDNRVQCSEYDGKDDDQVRVPGGAFEDAFNNVLFFWLFLYVQEMSAVPLIPNAWLENKKQVFRFPQARDPVPKRRLCG
jgi:hypothetical protein